MTLSIIIVNYNVRHYLEQCLTSVFAAAEGLDAEVFVVDNNSVDDSVAMVRERFPQVRLIVNADNPGFARANNQAMQQCTGEYVLLLNPDTIVEEETFRHCIDFIARTPRCGGVCVKMVNGEGLFLKESKRGFPSPATSFYKISGLIRLLPHHTKVGAYYMGHLSDDETHVVDILPGAFIMMRHEVLDSVGLLDESYFMYGEDIDFSWRIHLAGYDNYFLPSSRILHYKGECTKRGNMNYVYTFYNAMSIFVQKYFSGGNARFYNLLIQIAIWLRALLAMMQRAAKQAVVPMMDFILSFAGFYAVKELWATYWAENVNYYPDSYTWGVLPLYAIIIMFATWLCGGYDKPIRLGRIIKGVSLGAVALLVFYSLLDETQRYSRAILLFGSLATIISTLIVRLLLSLAGFEDYRLGAERKRRYLVVGGAAEQERIGTLFDQLGIVPQSVTAVESVTQIGEAAKMQHSDEIIFSADVSVKDMLDCMDALKGQKLAFRTAPSYGNLLIGSSYVYCLEELYTYREDIIATPRCRRNKRLTDLSTALLLLCLSPILILFQHRRLRYLSDCWQVLCGRKTWVGYSQPAMTSDTPLPYLKPSVLQTRHIMPRVKHPDMARLDSDYAQHYRVSTDIAILLRNWNRL